MIIILGKYEMSAFSTKLVSVTPSTIACAFACLVSAGFMKSVILFFVVVAILIMVRVVVVIVDVVVRAVFDIALGMPPKGWFSHF